MRVFLFESSCNMIYAKFEKAVPGFARKRPSTTNYMCNVAHVKKDFFDAENSQFLYLAIKIRLALVVNHFFSVI